MDTILRRSTAPMTANRGRTSMNAKLCLSPLCLVMLFLAAMQAKAECPYVEYTVTGSIRDVTGHALGNARVLVLFDRMATTDAEDTTDQDGDYGVKFLFDSFVRTALFGTDKCGREPDLLEVVVWKAGFRTVRKRLKRKDFNIIENGLVERQIELGAISLEHRR